MTGMCWVLAHSKFYMIPSSLEVAILIPIYLGGDCDVSNLSEVSWLIVVPQAFEASFLFTLCGGLST